MDAGVAEREPQSERATSPPSVAARFADFTAGLSLDQVPPELVRKAKLHMLDALGTALAASTFDFAGPTLEGASKLGKGDGALALGSGTPLPAAGAALVNGALIHGLDFDDTHIGAIYHASAPALAAALAAGEASGADGRDLLLAYIAGLEIGCRLGKAAGGGFHDRGFHPTPLCGAFAAAYAAGRLQGATPAQMVSASGLAGSMAAGVLELQGSWLKRMHPGWAAHSGIAAVALATSGFRGPSSMFEGPHGFFHTHLQMIPTGDASPAYGLGEDWLIAGIALKPYPCCHFIHGYVDCALELRDKVDLDQIERIELPLHKRLHHLVSGPARPSEPYAAMFSVPYTVALALVTGQVDLAAFHDKGVDDPAVLALSDRATCIDDPVSDFPARFPGEVRLFMKDGECISHRVPTSYGTPGRPMSEADIEAKFIANTTRVMPEPQARGILEQVLHIEALGSVAQLTRACTL